MQRTSSLSSLPLIACRLSLSWVILNFPVFVSPSPFLSHAIPPPVDTHLQFFCRDFLESRSIVLPCICATMHPYAFYVTSYVQSIGGLACTIESGFARLPRCIGLAQIDMSCGDDNDQILKRREQLGLSTLYNFDRLVSSAPGHWKRAWSIYGLFQEDVTAILQAPFTSAEHAGFHPAPSARPTRPRPESALLAWLTTAVTTTITSSRLGVFRRSRA